MAAVAGRLAVGPELACGCPGVVGCAEAVTTGVVLGERAELSAPATATAWPPRRSVAAYTPPAAMAESATSAIVAAARPARKLISSSRALTAARRRAGTPARWYPPALTAMDDTDKDGRRWDYPPNPG